MCGILGVYNLDGQPFLHENLVNMAKQIAHRGPDGEGYYLKDNIGLAHKRLSIIDVSERGAQPMTSKDGKWVVVFNGCIYNFLELKQELKAKGHVFNSTTDTEVIVEGLSAYGPDFFEITSASDYGFTYQFALDLEYEIRDNWSLIIHSSYSHAVANFTFWTANEIRIDKKPISYLVANFGFRLKL